MAFNFVSVWNFDNPTAYPPGAASVVQSQDKLVNPGLILSPIILIGGSGSITPLSQLPSQDSLANPGLSLNILTGSTPVAADGAVLASSDIYASDALLLSIARGK